MINRKEIDILLIELDKFIKDNLDWLDINNLFINIFKRNHKKQKFMSSRKKELWLTEIPTLVNTYWSQKRQLRKQRTEYFVRKVAYWLKYKEVKDFSYEEIFMKMAFNSDNPLYKPKQIIDINKPIPFNTFLIPEEWYHDDKIYIY